MLNFIVGTVFGIVVATIGLSGIASLADRGIEATKEIVQEAAKN